MSARPFTEQEFATISAHFSARGDSRHRLLLALGCGTGFRIHELASITVGHVWADGEITRELIVARRDLKGGAGAYRRSVRSRRVPLAESVRTAIAEHLARLGTQNPARRLLSSTRANAGGLDRGQAYIALVRACEACGIDALRISTHSLRKTFARRVYEASGRDLIRTQRIIGHTSPITTARYLETDSAELDRLVLGLAA